MKQWEIWNFPYPSAEKYHPVVVISQPGICASPLATFINGLVCTSIVGSRDMLGYEARLDQDDGLDRPTAVNCAIVVQLPKASVMSKERRGSVTLKRRKEIVRKLNAAFGFAELF